MTTGLSATDQKTAWKLQEELFTGKKKSQKTGRHDGVQLHLCDLLERWPRYLNLRMQQANGNTVKQDRVLAFIRSMCPAEQASLQKIKNLSPDKQFKMKAPKRNYMYKKKKMHTVEDLRVLAPEEVFKIQASYLKHKKALKDRPVVIKPMVIKREPCKNKEPPKATGQKTAWKLREELFTGKKKSQETGRHDGAPLHLFDLLERWPRYLNLRMQQADGDKVKQKRVLEFMASMCPAEEASLQEIKNLSPDKQLKMKPPKRNYMYKKKKMHTVEDPRVLAPTEIFRIQASYFKHKKVLEDRPVVIKRESCKNEEPPKKRTK